MVASVPAGQQPEIKIRTPRDQLADRVSELDEGSVRFVLYALIYRSDADAGRLTAAVEEAEQWRAQLDIYIAANRESAGQ
jgi:hypothetical protein